MITPLRMPSLLPHDLCHGWNSSRWPPAQEYWGGLPLPSVFRAAAAAAVSSVVSDSVRPHRRQPTRLPRPWDSPGKNTGVGCQFLLQCMKVKSESEVAQSCQTLSDLMGCSLPGSSVHGFSRQEYWSGVPLPSLTFSSYIAKKVKRSTY